MVWGACMPYRFGERRRDRSLLRLISIMALGALTSGCASVAGGPARLIPIEEEIASIRQDMGGLRFDPTVSQRDYRNNLIAARMYAIDIQYTAYESALTRERQNVGFGAAAATLGLTTASGLVASTGTKDL